MAKRKAEDYTKRIETAQSYLAKVEGKGTIAEVRAAKKQVRRAQRGLKRVTVAATHAARRDKKTGGDGGE